MRYVLGGIDKVRDGYVAVVRRLVRLSIIGVVFVVAALAGASGLFRLTPQSFLPEEDQGAFFAALRLPEGASINRTAKSWIRSSRSSSRSPGSKACCRSSASTSSTR